jgi:outer membrane protein TolC
VKNETGEPPFAYQFLLAELLSGSLFMHGDDRMRFLRLQFLRSLVAASLAATLIVPAIAQQTTPEAPSQSAPAPPSSPQTQKFSLVDYSQPSSHFWNPIAPYAPHHVAPADLSNTWRMSGLLRDGKIYLSMDDAVSLTLENNLDIVIARYNLNIADTDILRAKAGGAILGVNSGVVENTPGGLAGGLGGTVGSGTGGTSAGAAGVGSGTGGLVVSTLGSGPALPSYDPILTGTLQLDHNHILSASSFAVPVTSQNTGLANFAYIQGFHTGTNVQVGFNNNRITTSSPFATLSPTLNSNFSARITQHLLQGFGFAPNDRFIRIAKNNREITDISFRLQVITTVDQIENIYWNLVYAYEYVRVQQEALNFAQKTLSDTKKQVEIGTLAPIEVVRAQSTVAADLQTLTLAQTNLQLQQLLMKNALSRNLVDPVLADADVIPTSTMALPAQEPVAPTEELVNQALTHRAELAQLRINLTNTQISNQAIRSSLLPTVDLFAYYGGSGLGGAQNPSNLCSNNGDTFGCATTAVPSVGYGTTLNQLVDSTASDKGVGINISIPLRNRLAQATQIRSQLEYRQSEVRLQQFENQVRIEVRNAQFAVQQNRASVDSAQAAVELAQQSLDAEQKKYALGASTTTLVLQNENALAQAQSTLVSAMAAYEKAKVEMDRATGLLLENSGIQIADAENGVVNSPPRIPYVKPQEKPLPSVLPPTAQTPQQQQQEPNPQPPPQNQPQPQSPQEPPNPQR